MIENSHLKQLLDDLSSLVQTACIIQNGISIKRLSFMKLGTASWFSNITNLQVDDICHQCNHVLAMLSSDVLPL